MKTTCGIIGLPNVGKSTLFKLLTNIPVKINNFPFSTIKPNYALAQVYDDRLYQIHHITKSKSIIPDTIEFIDIAGLIKGAHKGEGLGDKIFQYVKTAKILCHVVRCFNNDSIIHIENHVNPKKDIDIINTELIYFDILQCEKYIISIKKNHNTNNYTNQILYCLKKCLDHLYRGVELRKIQFSKTDIEYIKKLNFLTFKPVIYIANIDEKKNNIYLEQIKKIGFFHNIPVIPFCFIKNNKSKLQFKNNNTILNSINNNIKLLLNLNTFFTINIKIIKSWLIPVTTIALDAAYKVHSDFKKGFIRVQVIKFSDFINCQGEAKAKKFGKIYCAGKDYQVQDGDILKFLFQK